MRTIKFRGLRTDGKGWVYGDLVTFGDERSIRVHSSQENAIIGAIVMVNTETVGQFTGLTDMNGVEVWEGDTVTYYNRFSCKTYSCTVKWDDRWATFALFEDGKEYAVESDWVKIEAELTVTGNIHTP